MAKPDNEKPLLDLKTATPKSPKRLRVWSDRVELATTSPFHTNSDSIPFDQISEVSVRTGPLFADVTIESTGGRVLKAERIKKSDATKARDLIHQLVASSRTIPPSAAQETAAPVTAKDHFDQLRQLGELRDSGVLTEEEFAAQKAKLLGT